MRSEEVRGKPIQEAQLEATTGQILPTPTAIIHQALMTD
jgi:hypothetical protein